MQKFQKHISQSNKKSENSEFCCLKEKCQLRLEFFDTFSFLKYFNASRVTQTSVTKRIETLFESLRAYIFLKDFHFLEKLLIL